MTVPLVSVVIPVYNQVDLLDRCLHALQEQTQPDLQVIVVSDASPESPREVLDRYPGTRLIEHTANLGYALTNNTGLAAAEGQYILFLNSDTELPPTAIEQMVAHLQSDPTAGGVTPLHRHPDGRLQRSCYRFPDFRFAWIWDSAIHRRWPDHPYLRDYSHADWDHESDRWVEHTMTSCLLIRREAYERIGGMDPNLKLFYNDLDFCLRMHRAGFPIWFLSSLTILHHGGASVATSPEGEAPVYGDRYRYCRKWFGWRGGVAVRWALWSSTVYDALAGLLRGRVRQAAGKLARGVRLNRALVASP